MRPVRLLSGILTVSGWTLMSRILGFARDVMLASLVGPGILMDAFVAAFRLPNMFRRFFAEGAFNAAFVPMFSKRLEGGEDGWLRYDGGAGAGMPGGIPPAHAQAGMAAPAQAGQMYAAGNRYAGHPSPSDAGGYLGMSGGEAPGYPGAAFGAAGVPQAIPPMRRMPGVWDPHTPSPMAGGMLMTDDDLATSAPGRLDRAGMRRVGSMGPNMFAMLGTSGGASVPRSGSQQSLATVDEMDPVERVRKRRRVSAQRSRVRKAMYILSLENENKLLRAELQRLHAATQAGAPQVLQAMDPPVTFPNKSDALKPEATVSQTIESLNPTRSEGLPDHGEVNS